MTPKTIERDVLRPQFCLVSGGSNGDCYRACLATITGIDAATMPNFMHSEGVTNAYEGLHLARTFLASHGLTIFDTWVTGEIDLARVLKDCSAFNPGIPMILTGKTARGDDDHAVVVLDGRITHDPSGAGLSQGSSCNCGAEGCTRSDWGLQIVMPASLRAEGPYHEQ